MTDNEMSDALGAALHSSEMQMDEITQERDALRSALQNIIWGIQTGAVKIETAQDETWANAMSKAHKALAIGERRQS